MSSGSRREGIARKLFKKFEAVAEKKGCLMIISSAEETNGVSLKMHRALGLKECGFISGLPNTCGKEIFFSKKLENAA